MKKAKRKTRRPIDDEPSLPLYERIRRYILKGIGSGAWPDGGRIPSEHELVAQFGVSRMTVNRALRELTNEGVLVRVKGLGTFAAKLNRAQSALARTEDISEEITLRGHKHSSRVLTLKKLTPSADILEQLEMPAGGAVYHSQIVHYENGAPVQLEERWVNPIMAPQYLAQDFSKITPHRYLLSCAAIAQIEHIIHAVLPSEREAKLLKIGRGDPCLMLLRRTWGGRMVATFSRFIYPGDRYTLGGRFKADDPELALSGNFSGAAKMDALETS